MIKKFAQIFAALLALLVIAAVGYWQYVERIGNDRVARELRENPQGARAARAMLLELPSGRKLPVNYIREGDFVYAAADGRWWSELTGQAHPVRMLIRGTNHTGQARAILDDPKRTADVFERLRPNAIEGFGRLIEIRITPSEPTRSGAD